MISFFIYDQLTLLHIDIHVSGSMPLRISWSSEHYVRAASKDFGLLR